VFFCKFFQIVFYINLGKSCTRILLEFRHFFLFFRYDLMTNIASNASHHWQKKQSVAAVCSLEENNIITHNETYFRYTLKKKIARMLSLKMQFYWILSISTESKPHRSVTPQSNRRCCTMETTLRHSDR